VNLSSIINYLKLTLKEIFQKPMTENTIIQVNPIVAAFYDCVLMYAWAFNKTLALGGDPKDGRTLMRRLWSKSFQNGTKK